VVVSQVGAGAGNIAKCRRQRTPHRVAAVYGTECIVSAVINAWFCIHALFSIRLRQGAFAGVNSAALVLVAVGIHNYTPLLWHAAGWVTAAAALAAFVTRRPKYM
jgi:hypothetical protein